MTQSDFRNFNDLTNALKREIYQNAYQPDSYQRYKTFFHEISDRFWLAFLEKDFYCDPNPYYIFDVPESTLIYLFYQLPAHPIKAYAWQAVSDLTARIQSSFSSVPGRGLSPEAIQKIADLVESTYHLSDSLLKKQHLFILRIPHVCKHALGQYTRLHNSGSVAGYIESFQVPDQVKLPLEFILLHEIGHAVHLLLENAYGLRGHAATIFSTLGVANGERMADVEAFVNFFACATLCDTAIDYLEPDIGYTLSQKRVFKGLVQMLCSASK